MRRTLCTLAAVAGAATSASATWSIILINTRTGEIAVGSATCLTGFDLQANTPVLVPGVGAATAQSYVDQGGYNRVFIRDRLLEGVEPNDIINLLSAFDSAHQTRQYGIADVMGGAATFTGTGAGPWAGGLTGRVGDVVYAVQGNVLAGSPVVFETEQTIVGAIASGSDLPETLMLAMEQARLWGGDGRCSCGNDADACGSPPDGWNPDTGKSAHIAYMLVARTGDGFGCDAIYRVGRGAWGLATGDFDEDGRVDALVAASDDSRIAFLRNSASHPGYVTFDAPVFSAASGRTTAIAVADFDRDGHTDLCYADQTANILGQLRGGGDGTFADPAFDTLPDQPTWPVAGDLNADGWPDAAVGCTAAGVVAVLLNDGAGDLAPAAAIPAGVEPWGLVLAEIDGRDGLDLACADRAGNQVVILANDGAGGFSAWRQLPTLALPQQVTAGDFDGDGRTDLATADRQGQRISVFRQTDPGVFTAAQVGPTAPYAAIEAADLNEDGLDDLAATNFSSPARLTLLLGQPSADPVPQGVYPAGASTNDLVIADFSGDRQPDVLHNTRGNGGIVGLRGLDPSDNAGYFGTTTGCATADYFAGFNVAFQTRDAPDPVAQLHDLYDDWRTDLLGITDAIRSTVQPDTDRMPAGATTRLHIRLRDWELTPVGQGLTVWVTHAPGSAGLTRFGPTEDLGDGAYTIPVSGLDLPPGARGTDSLEVHVHQTGHHIVLMPAQTLTITGPLADWNGDGTVDRADLEAFLSDWQAGDLTADLTGDGMFNALDLLGYLAAWAGD